MKHLITIYLLLNIYLLHGQTQVSDTVDISFLYNVTIVFEEDIVGDPIFGSTVAINYSLPDTKTIAIKADGQFMAERKVSRISKTNLTVRTKTKLFNFIIDYEKEPERTIILPYMYKPVHVYQTKSDDTDNKKVSESVTDDNILLTLADQSQDYYDIGFTSGQLKMTMQVTNIWVDSDFIYIKFYAENDSEVPYDIDYHRYVTTYKPFSFNQSTKPIADLQPLKKLISNPDPITIGLPYVNVLVFEKFTLNKKEYLNIQIGEENGSRLISVPVSWKDILEAKALPN